MRRSPSNKGTKIQNKELISDTDSEIENDLPIHPTQGYKNHWAAIMRAKDEEELQKERKEREELRVKQTRYRKELETQIKAQSSKSLCMREANLISNLKEKNQMVKLKTSKMSNPFLIAFRDEKIRQYRKA